MFDHRKHVGTYKKFDFQISLMDFRLVKNKITKCTKLLNVQNVIIKILYSLSVIITQLFV